MGEYSRFNNTLREHEERLEKLRAELASKPVVTDDELEYLCDLQQEIGELKGALLEMASIDGLDDPFEAFDY